MDLKLILKDKIGNDFFLMRIKIVKRRNKSLN